MKLEFFTDPPEPLHGANSSQAAPDEVPFYPADLPVLTFTNLDKLRPFQRQYAYALARRARITGESIIA